MFKPKTEMFVLKCELLSILKLNLKYTPLNKIIINVNINVTAAVQCVLRVA